jgi:hypothetical protein
LTLVWSTQALHLKSPHIVGLFCPYSRSLLTLVWQALHLKSPHIVGLFCPCSRSLLTLVWSTQISKSRRSRSRS